MKFSYLVELRCSKCGMAHSADSLQGVCRSCSSVLLAVYDLDAVRRVLRRTDFGSRVNSMWRYHEVLPAPDEQSIVSLGEGWTPLLTPSRLAAEMGVPGLLIKEEGCNPTGSFKARGLSAAITRARMYGVRSASMPSAGNAGGALSAYAAGAGISAHVFVPEDTPRVNLAEVGFFGGTIHTVAGDISDAAKAMAAAKKPDWFDLSTMKEPYRLEGKKTLGYELAEQLGWRLPDAIVYPTGGGTGLIGMWKAFDELEKLGWLFGPKPRMISVQMSGCAPIVEAFGRNLPRAEFWINAATVAAGLRVPKAFADELILSALYKSGGAAVAVEDAEAIATMKRAARLEGIFLSPEGAAALAAVPKLLLAGLVDPGEKIVVFNTGSGYKYTELFIGKESAGA